MVRGEEEEKQSTFEFFRRLHKTNDDCHLMWKKIFLFDWWSVKRSNDTHTHTYSLIEQWMSSNYDNVSHTFTHKKRFHHRYFPMLILPSVFIIIITANTHRSFSFRWIEKEWKGHRVCLFVKIFAQRERRESSLIEHITNSEEHVYSKEEKFQHFRIEVRVSFFDNYILRLPENVNIEINE